MFIDCCSLNQLDIERRKEKMELGQESTVRTVVSHVLVRLLYYLNLSIANDTRDMYLYKL